VVLRPLPFSEPDTLVRLYEVTPQGARFGFTSEPTFLDWKAMTRSFADVGACTLFVLDLTGVAEPVTLTGEAVSHNFASLLGIDLVLGRGFTAAEDAPGASGQVVILDEGLWQRAFGGAADVIGRTVNLGSTPRTVIGVADLGSLKLIDGLDHQFLLPLMADPKGSRGNHFAVAIARLAPGASVQSVRAEISTLAAHLAEANPTTSAGWGADVVTLREATIGPDVSRMVTLVFAAVGLLLLLACTNVSSLLVAHGTGRLSELGMRVALGAGRGRLVRQLLTESLVLSLVGGALGVLIALWGRDSMRAFIPPAPIPIGFEVPLDTRVLSFALVAALVTGILFGLIPALLASRADLVSALRDGAATGPARRSRLQSTLVAAQVAMAIVSLVCAGLFARGLQRARAVDTGIGAPDGVLLVNTNLFLAGYADSAAPAAIDRLLEQVRALPGVRSAGLATMVPLGFGGWQSGPMAVEGHAFRPDENPTISWSAVSSDYFETVRTPVLRGRGVTADDRRGSLPVAVVNETFARRYWPGQDPLGRRVVLDGRPRTVVGVSRDTKHQWLHLPARPVAYFPIQQQYVFAFTLHVRTAGDPHQLQQALRSAFERVSPNLPFNDPRTFAENMTSVTFLQGMGAAMLTAFGSLALALAAIGLYGVIAYSVAQRTREMGVRLAIGASRWDVMGLVVGRAVRLTLVGVGVGIVLAAGAGQLLRSQIFGVSPLDPVTFGGVVLLLGAVAVLAAWLPARRAAGVDPIVALQSE